MTRHHSICQTGGHSHGQHHKQAKRKMSWQCNLGNLQEKNKTKENKKNSSSCKGMEGGILTPLSLAINLHVQPAAVPAQRLGAIRLIRSSP